VGSQVGITKLMSSRFLVLERSEATFPYKQKCAVQDDGNGEAKMSVSALVLVSMRAAVLLRQRLVAELGQRRSA